MAACWTGPPPPPGRSSSAADTHPAPLGDTPDGSLSAPAGSSRWVLRSVMAASAGSCFPDSEYAASCTWTALGAKSRSEVERIRGRIMRSVSLQWTRRLSCSIFNPYALARWGKDLRCEQRALRKWGSCFHCSDWRRFGSCSYLFQMLPNLKGHNNSDLSTGNNSK